MRGSPVAQEQRFGASVTGRSVAAKVAVVVVYATLRDQGAAWTRASGTKVGASSRRKGAKGGISSQRSESSRTPGRPSGREAYSASRSTSSPRVPARPTQSRSRGPSPRATAAAFSPAYSVHAMRPSKNRFCRVTHIPCLLLLKTTNRMGSPSSTAVWTSRPSIRKAPSPQKTTLRAPPSAPSCAPTGDLEVVQRCGGAVACVEEEVPALRQVRFDLRDGLALAERPLLPEGEHAARDPAGIG